MDADQNGRIKVVKHGTKEITREGFEYELTVNFELINDKHLCKASKDRTGLFMNKPEFVINASTGKKLIQWCEQESGIEVNKAKLEIAACESIEALRHIYSKYPKIQDTIKPLIIDKKQILESRQSQIISNSQIMQQSKNQKNGINNSK